MNKFVLRTNLLYNFTFTYKHLLCNNLVPGHLDGVPHLICERIPNAEQSTTDILSPIKYCLFPRNKLFKNKENVL